MEQGNEIPWSPLRAVYPQLYEVLVQHLGTVGMHPYNVHAEAAELGDNLAQLRIGYGNDFAEHATISVNQEQIQSMDEEIMRFFVEVSALCHDAAIRNYKEFMKM